MSLDICHSWPYSESMNKTNELIRSGFRWFAIEPAPGQETFTIRDSIEGIEIAALLENCSREVKTDHDILSFGIDITQDE